MSDNSISIVCKKSTYPHNKDKAAEILEWLVSCNIVKPTLSDCVLGSTNGYAVSDGAKAVVNEPDYLRYGLATNGFEIVTERTIFDTGGNGMRELICLKCKTDISQENWDFLQPWSDGETDGLLCPACGERNEIHNFDFVPEWGFSDLGFTFWNWPPFKNEFINDFKQRLGCDINIVFSHI
jgi:DNA-directed RNA polymerase subunit RPC12/RpoP